MTILGLAMGMPVSGSGAQETSGLPSGATSLRETHGDWTIGCSAGAERGKGCTLFQQQVDRHSRQRVHAIELQPEDGGVRGTLVLPFGLAFEAGVALQIDGTDLGQSLHFRTCLPRGCLVPTDFDSRTVAKLRRGDVLEVAATVADGGKKTAFSISLKGFARALDRTAELLRPVGR
jgi:invasion protein IalB